MFLKDSLLVLIGGSLYVLLELVWRGRSHWSMALTGGLCFLAAGGLNELSPAMPLIAQAVLGGGIITGLELATGLLVNRDYSVWNYAAVPVNYRGQICLLYSTLWVLLSFVIVFADDALRRVLFAEPLPGYRFF